MNQYIVMTASHRQVFRAVGILAAERDLISGRDPGEVGAVTKREITRFPTKVRAEREQAFDDLVALGHLSVDYSRSTPVYRVSAQGRHFWDTAELGFVAKLRMKHQQYKLDRAFYDYRHASEKRNPLVRLGLSYFHSIMRNGNLAAMTFALPGEFGLYGSGMLATTAAVTWDAMKVVLFTEAVISTRRQYSERRAIARDEPEAARDQAARRQPAKFIGDREQTQVFGPEVALPSNYQSIAAVKAAPELREALRLVDVSPLQDEVVKELMAIAGKRTNAALLAAKYGLVVQSVVSREYSKPGSTLTRDEAETVLTKYHERAPEFLSAMADNVWLAGAATEHFRNVVQPNVVEVRDLSVRELGGSPPERDLGLDSL